MSQLVSPDEYNIDYYKYKKKADKAAQKLANRTGYSAYYYNCKEKRKTIKKGKSLVKVFMVHPE